jgi:pyridoxal phosphate enzyme (YggS family)
MIAAALADVRRRIADAAVRAGRDPGDVRLVGVCKGVDPSRVAEAVAAGLDDVGVNRAKELAEKAEALGTDVAWHYLGAIQTNKARQLAGVRLVHGLYREREAEALEAVCAPAGRTLDALVQVNIADEASKQGVAPGQTEALIARLEAYPHVRLRGFMFVAPQAENPEDVRWVFREGRRLRERFEGSGLDELSMGMTDDFEVAIEEGATIVRIGRAIFSPTAASEEKANEKKDS